MNSKNSLLPGFEIVISEHKESGSIMLMTMIIMVAMLFSGLFVMEMAIIEEATIGNEQQALQVYQTAYSELEAQIEYLDKTPEIFKQALGGKDVALPVHIYPSGCTVLIEPCQSVILSFIGEVPTPSGYSLTDFKGMSFEILSSAVMETTGAQSNQVMSVIYIVNR